jgi:RNA 3'-terminal phosphate cyclase (ATP)
VIEIPGNMLEGGGQIVRTAISLAALFDKEVKITKIRDNRPKPGLQAQHAAAIQAVASISNAETEGSGIGSRELVFRPRGRVAGKFSLDVGTAGSVPLILQAIMPAAAYAPGRVDFDLTGGTDVPWSPTIDYLRLVELPILRLMGYAASLRVGRRGHYPKGGGRVEMSIEPAGGLRAFRVLERGSLIEVEGISHCVKLPSHVAQRQASAAKQRLESEGVRPVNIAVEAYPPDRDMHRGPGSSITLAILFSCGIVLGSDSLGQRGKPAERVGEEAAARLLTEFKSDATLDRHMGDIIIPYMAVASGQSIMRVSEITKHMLTNIKVTETVAELKFYVQGELHGPGTIAVEGTGLRP